MFVMIVRAGGPKLAMTSSSVKGWFLYFREISFSQCMMVDRLLTSVPSMSKMIALSECPSINLQNPPDRATSFQAQIRQRLTLLQAIIIWALNYAFSERASNSHSSERADADIIENPKLEAEHRQHLFE